MAVERLVDGLVADVASACAHDEASIEGVLGQMEDSESFQFEAAAVANDEQFPVNWPLGRASIDETSADRAKCVPASHVLHALQHVALFEDICLSRFATLGG